VKAIGILGDEDMNSHSRLRLGAATAVLLLAAVVPPVIAAGPENSGQQRPARGLADELLKRIHSPDAGERQAAEKELSSIAALLQEPDLVKQLAESTDDPQLKAFFLQRLDQLKNREAAARITKLSPISLGLKDSSLAQAVDSINLSLDTGKFQKLPGGDGLRLTLDVKDMPLWEVFLELQKIQPIRILSSNSGIRLERANERPRYALNGPAIAWVSSIDYRHVWLLNTPAESRPSFTVGLAMAVDPRLHVIGFGGWVVSSAVDDGGQNLAPSPAAPPAAGSPAARNIIGGDANLAGNAINTQVPLDPPAQIGKFLTLGVDSVITVSSAERVATLDDMQNNVGKLIPLDDRTFRVVRFDMQNKTLRLQIDSVQPAQNAPVRSTGGIRYTILDAAGTSMWTTTSAARSEAITLSVPGTGPFKLVIAVPSGMIDIPVHFEFKDLPLP
jgi:hypothetical protein